MEGLKLKKVSYQSEGKSEDWNEEKQITEPENSSSREDKSQTGDGQRPPGTGTAPALGITGEPRDWLFVIFEVSHGERECQEVHHQQ